MGESGCLKDASFQNIQSKKIHASESLVLTNKIISVDNTHGNLKIGDKVFNSSRELGIGLKTNEHILVNNKKISNLAEPTSNTDAATKQYVDNVSQSIEGADLSSTGVGGTNKFLRADGDGSCSWQISGEDATTSTKGIASFSSDNFNVSSGAVSIKDGGVNLSNEITDTLGVGNGGTGATTFTSNSLLTGNGTSAIQSETSLTYDSETLTIGENDDGEVTIKRSPATSSNGGKLYIQAGNATGANLTGGDLELYGGAGTGDKSGGSIIFYSHEGGNSGSTQGTFTECATLGPSGNLSIDGNLKLNGTNGGSIQSKGYDGGGITFSTNTSTAQTTFVTRARITSTSGSDSQGTLELLKGCSLRFYNTTDEEIISITGYSGDEGKIKSLAELDNQSAPSLHGFPVNSQEPSFTTNGGIYSEREIWCADDVRDSEKYDATHIQKKVKANPGIWLRGLSKSIWFSSAAPGYARLLVESNIGGVSGAAHWRSNNRYHSTAATGLPSVALQELNSHGGAAHQKGPSLLLSGGGIMNDWTNSVGGFTPYYKEISTHPVKLIFHYKFESLDPDDEQLSGTDRHKNYELLDYIQARQQNKLLISGGTDIEMNIDGIITSNLSSGNFQLFNSVDFSIFDNTPGSTGVITGTIDTGGSAPVGEVSATMILEAGSSEADDYYNNMRIITQNPTLSGTITDYTGSTRTITVTWDLSMSESTPDGPAATTSSTTYVIEPTSTSSSDSDARKFHVEGSSGNVVAAGTVTASGSQLTSDRKFKEDIYYLDENIIEKILKLKPCQYVLKNDKNKEKNIGLIAQDVKEIFPNTVIEKDNRYYLNYTSINTYLIKAFQENHQEMKKEIHQKQEKIDHLEQEIQSLNQRVDQLFEMMKSKSP